MLLMPSGCEGRPLVASAMPFAGKTELRGFGVVGISRGDRAAMGRRRMVMQQYNIKVDPHLAAVDCEFPLACGRRPVRFKVYA